MSHKQKYLTYEKGEINLILSAPHSGELTPKTIPTRKKGQRLKDGYTDRITKGLLEYFGYKPYYIYANIHRMKVDLNRDLEEATGGSKRAEKIWYEWDSILRYFLANASNKFPKTLYVDIHSHNNSDEFHLGYGMSSRKYLDFLRGVHSNVVKTSLDAFPHDKYDMIFGKNSFKYLLEKRGYGVFVPQTKAQYFSGGRNVKTYRSKNVGAIQVEIPTSLANRDLKGIISCLGDCIQGFKEEYVDTYSEFTFD